MQKLEESTEVSTDENIDNMELDTKTPETSSDVAGDMLVLEKEEKAPLQLELEEEGFEILDLDEISVDVKSVKKVTETVTDTKKKHRKVFGRK